MGPITQDEIRRQFSTSTYRAGLEYLAAGRVSDVRVEPDGFTVEARVQGSAPLPYVQKVRVIRHGKAALLLSGHCSCPVGYNCKHVAAAMLAYQSQRPARAVQSSGAFRIADSGRVGAMQRASAPAPLPPDIDAWLRGMEQAEEIEAASEDYPPTVRRRMLYLLDRDAHSGVVVSAVSAELNRDGSFAPATKRYSPAQVLAPGQQPKFLRPSDQLILRRLASFGGAAGETFPETLRAIIATGRGRWRSVDGPVLTLAPAVSGTLSWLLAEDGRQRAQLALPGSLVPLHLAAPWYIDPATGAMGAVETELPPRLAQAVLASPWLPPALAGRVQAEMSGRLRTAIPAPQAVSPPRTLREELQPCLKLLAVDLPSVPISRWNPTLPPAIRTPMARLSWRYGPVTVPVNAAQGFATHAGRLVEVVRNPRGEARAIERLRNLGFARPGHVLGWSQNQSAPADYVLTDADPAAWFEVMLRDVPDLRREGWLVEVAADFPIRIAEPEGDPFFEVEQGSGIDWFDLDLGVMVDGERISLIPPLLDFIADAGIAFLSRGADDTGEDAPLLLPLADGRVLPIALRRLRPILPPLFELFSGGLDAASGAVRLSVRDAAGLALLEDAAARSGLAWSGGEAMRALGRTLRDHGGLPPCAAPAGFQAALRPYQAHGLAWLQFLRSAGLGGILADDMGLGKTVQALAHLAVEQEAGRLDRPALIVCPTSLAPNWRAEAERFAPSLRTLVLHGKDRAAQFGAIGDHDLVITTYPLFARDHAVLSAQDWRVVVLDEAQMIKNPLATTSKLARTLRAGQRLCLSGTPLENHLGELWSLFDFMLPGFLGDRQSFGRMFRSPIEKGGDADRQAVLSRRVAPFLLRRTKAQVAADLPPKTEITETVELGEAQRAIYEGIRLAMHAKVRAAVAKRGLSGAGIVILDAMLKLRQACCDPRLLKLATARAAKAGSAKLGRLMELVPQLVEEGRRVLVFSQFTSMLALIEAELAERGLPYLLLTGDTKDRATPVRRFQAGETALFLISLKAGGVGLNLTAADTVIHYDPWWNPAVEDQATDRAHRIGQDKPVFVHKLISAGTIEEKMQVLKARKQALADAVLGASASTASSLTEGDLEMLFAPVV